MSLLKRHYRVELYGGEYTDELLRTETFTARTPGSAAGKARAIFDAEPACGLAELYRVTSDGTLTYAGSFEARR